jgi:hypothetical protein
MPVRYPGPPGRSTYPRGYARPRGPSTLRCHAVTSSAANASRAGRDRGGDRPQFDHHFVDGQRGDGALEANGIIVDDGTPPVVASARPRRRRLPSSATGRRTRGGCARRGRAAARNPRRAGSSRCRPPRRPASGPHATRPPPRAPGSCARRPAVSRPRPIHTPSSRWGLAIIISATWSFGMPRATRPRWKASRPAATVSVAGCPRSELSSAWPGPTARMAAT